MQGDGNFFNQSKAGEKGIPKNTILFFDIPKLGVNLQRLKKSFVALRLKVGLHDEKIPS